MTLDSLPDLEYKRVVSCKDSFHGTDVLAVSEHGAPGRRPNIHTHFVGRQREDGLDTLPARAAEANRSTLIADIPFPALETSQPSGASDSELQLEFDRFPIRPLSISAGTDLLASPGHGLSRADCGEPHTEKV